MYPDVSKMLPARKGMSVTLVPVALSTVAHGNGKDWDLYGVMGAEDENGLPTAYAVSLAVKATKRQIRTLLQNAEDRYVMIRGRFGPEERDSSGAEVFRRVFCKPADIVVVQDMF